MKNYNWILALLFLAAAPLHATTVSTFTDTDSMLSRYRDSDASHTDGVRDHARRGHREARRTSNDRSYGHEENNASDGEAHYPLQRIMRSHRKIHFTESFDIEKAGTYQISIEDLDHEVLPIDFGIKFTSGYDHHRLDFKKNEDGFLFDAMPGEYEISIWANGHHKIHGGEFNVHVTAIDASPVPVPAAVWLFGSGLLGLIGIARRKTNRV